MGKITFTLFAGLMLVSFSTAQVPTATLIKIVRAEDTRDAEPLAELILNKNAAIRTRSALAAGRIGDIQAVPALRDLLEKDPSDEVRTMAAFALGEIESINAADAILKTLKDPATSNTIRARSVEAAGKIAAANPREARSKPLGLAIIECLNTQASMKLMRDNSVTLQAITAALRAHPEGSDTAVAVFLKDSDPRIRADAANTLTRLRAKNANETLRKMLTSDTDAVARANAARALGAAEDKEAFDLLLTAATSDNDSRVRVSAIRSIASLMDVRAVDRLLSRGHDLLGLRNKSRLHEPVEISELLEIGTALGRLVPNTENEKVVIFLNELRIKDGFRSAETEIAFARVAPKAYVAARLPDDLGYRDTHIASAYAQGLAEIAASKDEELKVAAGEKLRRYVDGMATGVKPADQAKMVKAMPELTQALAAFKPDNIDEILRGQLANSDTFIRAAAAGAIADRRATKENTEALKSAFIKALLVDKHDDDAQLAILIALYRLDKKAGSGTFLMALNAIDYLVRKTAFELLKDPELQKDFPGIPTSLELAREKHKDQVLPYSPAFGTKLGQVLNTDVDYRRALARKNGTVKAVLTTEKGTFTIEFYPEDAPLTVDNFVKLARSGYFNGLEVHRVVPNFVMQDGDPRGDGNGGPGWSIRCEVNMRDYDRGAVGMALSGKDTGGSQWFVTHSPQPHLDGGYTVFGHVNETDMKVVDNIVRGDKIISVKIIGR
ncbi:hypothetical protein BH10ACI3_BH10ACI3_12940 [soil metagenome]